MVLIETFIPHRVTRNLLFLFFFVKKVLKNHFDYIMIMRWRLKFNNDQRSLPEKKQHKREGEKKNKSKQKNKAELCYFFIYKNIFFLGWCSENAKWERKNERLIIVYIMNYRIIVFLLLSSLKKDSEFLESFLVKIILQQSHQRSDSLASNNKKK